MTSPQKNISAKASALSARLMAVQAVYQAMLNEQKITDAGKEYLKHRVNMMVEGEEMVEPDRKLVTMVVRGVEERFEDLKSLLEHHLSEKSHMPEPLIQAILVCGFYEMLENNDVDVPIIINDYLNVAHGFFGKGEVGLINGILDSAAKGIRD